MRNLEILLKNKSVNYDRLEEFGFQKKQNEYIYYDDICDEQFQVVIFISEKKNIPKL
ncbi:MAG: hypothetical protein IJ220_07465 [Clostridia bacterium]|nr:hypothetical protein [Clostridia bacterium]